MTWRPSHDDGPQRAFLVERYLSPATAVDLAEVASRTARMCADADRAGARVRYLYSAYLPTEDTCFCLFLAPSADAVRAVNNHAGFAFDRLIPAVLMLGTDIDLPPDDPSP